MATAEDDDILREQKGLFAQEVMERFKMMKDDTERSQFLTEEKFGDIAECVSKWHTLSPEEKKVSKWSQGYAWARKYALISAGGSDVLVFKEPPKKKNGGETESVEEAPAAPPALDQTVLVSHQGRVFNDLRDVHIEGGHCKGMAFRTAMDLKFGKSVPHWVLSIFLRTCPTCTRRLPRKPSSAGHKPILTKGLGSREQVDLIDFQSCPDGNFKFFLNYQDHAIKLYDNASLTSKRNGAIAFALLDIFTRIGAPMILQADNGREFSGTAGKSIQLTDQVRRAARNFIRAQSQESDYAI